MIPPNPTLAGVYLPLVTPFQDGKVDDVSLDRLIARYRGSGVAGLVLLGTTGESPVLTAAESEQIIAQVAGELAGALPLYLGVSGNDTRSVATTMPRLNQLAVDGYLLTCPYYNRPSQRGLVAHFSSLAQETDRDLILYNIPYRTGVNLGNEAIFELAELHSNIVGVKDSGANIQQTLELIRESSGRLAILAGEDHLFFLTVALGGAGGILAAAHLQPEAFVATFNALRDSDLAQARELWNPLSAWIPQLFAEPNPVPVKAWLAEQGLITSPECRLPLTPISQPLAAVLGKILPIDDSAERFGA